MTALIDSVKWPSWRLIRVLLVVVALPLLSATSCPKFDDQSRTFTYHNVKLSDGRTVTVILNQEVVTSGLMYLTYVTNTLIVLDPVTNQVIKISYDEKKKILAQLYIPEWEFLSHKGNDTKHVTFPNNVNGVQPSSP